MDKPPMEWIDKLFECMALFYGERWSRQFAKGAPESLFKTIWQSAMTGCTYDEIKCTLVLLKREATRYTFVSPPNHMEFFRKAKNHPRPANQATPVSKAGDPLVAKRAIDEIREKLRYKDALK